MFQAMHRQGVVADVVTYSSAVKASSNGQEWQLAMQLLCSMLQEWLAPDVTTYSCAELRQHMDNPAWGTCSCAACQVLLALGEPERKDGERGLG